jgi:hypothetical protein
MKDDLRTETGKLHGGGCSVNSDVRESYSVQLVMNRLTGVRWWPGWNCASIPAAAYSDIFEGVSDAARTASICSLS